MSKISKPLQNLYRDFPGLPPIEDRYSSDSWVYDGKSFALRKHPGRNYKAFEILHEICHWMIADDDQRDFPEFALYPGVVDFMAWGTPEEGFRDENGRLNWKATQDAADGYLDPDEQYAQEVATQKLTILLGEKYQVPVKIVDLPEIHSWKDYQNYKSKEDWDTREEILRRADELFQSCLKEFDLM